VLHALLITAIVLVVTVGLLVGVLVFLGRYKNGRYLQRVGLFMAKVPYLRKQLVKMNQAYIEKQNPELASAMRKIQRVGATNDPKKRQQAYHSLSPEERRAYQELVDQQGGAPEPANRQMRRAQQRMTQTNRARPSGGGGSSGGKSSGSSSSKRGKKR
jgi:uncharacterized membrane protein YgcG